MSRDWRPVDQYAADKILTKRRRSLREAEIKLVIAGQPDILLTNPQAMADYPELSFLLNGFNNLYEQNKKNNAVRVVFEIFEKALKQAEAAFDDAVDSRAALPEDKKLYNLDDKELFHQPIANVVEEWFYGRLDSGFYYNEINDNKMHGFLVHKLQESKHREKPSEREL